MNQTKLFLVLLFLISLVSACSKKRALRSVQQVPTNQSLASPRLHVMKGRLLSISESDGLKGWVCEQNLQTPDPELEVYVNNSPISAPGLTLQLDNNNSAALTECQALEAQPFSFTVPYADLALYSGGLISVYGVPGNGTGTLVLLSNPGSYRVPTATSSQSQNPGATAPAPNSNPNPNSNSTPAPPTAPSTNPGTSSDVIPPAPTPIRYTVTGLSSPPEGGIVSGSAMIDAGQSLTLVATPNEGYSFQGWTNCPSSSAVNCVVNPTSSMNITATFVRQICRPTQARSQTCSVSNGKGSGTQTQTCNSDGLSWGDFGACSSITCQAGYALNQSECVWPGPNDAAISEKGKTPSQKVIGALEGREKSRQYFQGWVCQKDLRNSLKIQVYVGISTTNKRLVGTYTANSPAGTGVASQCSSIPVASRELGPHRFTIPLSVFSAADKGKKVFVYGLNHGTNKATLLPLKLHNPQDWSQVVPKP